MRLIQPIRVAALLLMTALAACSDTPTGAALAPPEAPALALAVSSSGGHPLVSWDPVPGATSYTVRFVTMLVFPSGGTQRLRTNLATTTGTSYLDTSRVYTGDTSCPRSDEYPLGPYIERYQYVIVSQLASGTSMEIVDAPVGECY